MVLSYDFNDGDEKRKRSSNKADLSNLKSLFSGNQNKIETISPSAKSIAGILSSQGIMETFKCCKY
jgi:hypothetical protein